MVKEWQFREMKGRKIWVPYMCDAAFLLAAAFRGKGFSSEVLPRSQDSLLGLGRKYTDGDQCLPSIITTEDILRRVFSPDFKPDEEAFFQGKSEGSCRFGRYYMNQLLILEKLGFGNVPIITLDNKNAYGGLGTDFKVFTWDGLVSQAILERMLHFTRPFELTQGKSEEVYAKSLDGLCVLIEDKIRKGAGKLNILLGKHNSEIPALLEEAYKRFSAIPKREEKKPLIFVTGEIFVRTSEVANQDLIRKIEALGGVALLEPAAGFFSYINTEKLERRKYHIRDLTLREWIKYYLEMRVLGRDTRKIEGVADLPRDPDSREVIERGSKYVHPTFTGEAIVTMGGCDYFASRAEGKVDGIVNTLPHSCMPGTICTALSKDLRAKYNTPFLNLAYDGHADPGREEQLEVFMYQVKERAGNSR